MAKKGGKNLLPIKRVVRVKLEDLIDAETLALIVAYQEWHKRQTGEKEAPGLGEVVDAAVREQVMGLSGFKAFFKEHETQQQGGGSRRGRAGAAGAATSSGGSSDASGGKSS